MNGSRSGYRAPRYSALYRGTVTHARWRPRRRAFRYAMTMAYLDLDELDALQASIPFFSLDRPNLLSFRRRDHLPGRPEPTLREAVLATVEQHLGARPDGAVRVLTQLRSWGWCFNPVTFYYCFRLADDGLVAILAEITNTPWGERHVYALSAEPGSHYHGAVFSKGFHISPFLPMDLTYRWRFTTPDARLRVRMHCNRTGGEPALHAQLMLRRFPLTVSALSQSLLRTPAMSAGAHAAIYWQALRRWLEGTPYYRHPGAAHADAASLGAVHLNGAQSRPECPASSTDQAKSLRRMDGAHKPRSSKTDRLWRPFAQ